MQRGWRQTGKDGLVTWKNCMICWTKWHNVALVCRVLFGPKIGFTTQNYDQLLEPHEYRVILQTVRSYLGHHLYLQLWVIYTSVLLPWLWNQKKGLWPQFQSSVAWMPQLTFTSESLKVCLQFYWQSTRLCLPQRHLPSCSGYINTESSAQSQPGALSIRR